MDKQQTPAPMSIDDAMTALTCGRTPRERLAAAEALAAAAQREADRIRAAIAREAL
ncbi:hypothetical protein [Xenophilus sp.]|uniref:hypothetical protein n=1 Tax=Xenophilus sp. TaxID=1873499 RepID=UPI0037DD7055